jgi:plastocyanin
MRRMLVRLPAALLATLPSTNRGAFSPTRALADNTSVTIQDIAFNPADVTIAAGDTVAIEFDTPGVYTYHCDIHPDLMMGTITVTG